MFSIAKAPHPEIIEVCKGLQQTKIKISKKQIKMV
jgi:hypothetical protein